MKPLNIVVTGEPTAIETLIRSISYGPEETISHSYQPKKQNQPVSINMNFGSLQVDEDYRINFFGGTDDNMFEFVAELSDTGMKGMIIILDAGVPADIEKLQQTISDHINYLKKYALVIGINGDDYPTVKQAEEQVRKTLLTFDAVAPVFSIDTSNKEDVNLLVESLLCFANPGIQENKGKKASFSQSK